MIAPKQPTSWEEARGDGWPPGPWLYTGGPDELTQELVTALELRDVKVGVVQLGLSHDGQDAAVSMTATIPWQEAPEGYCFALGFTTSNAERRKLETYAGLVTREGLGIPLTRLAYERKHSVGRDSRPWDRFGEDVAELFLHWAPQAKRVVQGLQRQEIPHAQFCRLLVEAGREELMPWSRLGKVEADYRRQAPGRPGTAWEFLVAFCIVVRMNPVIEQMRQSIGFLHLLRGEKP